MAKVIVVLLGIVAVTLAARWALEQRPRVAPGEISEQKRQLDNVRAKAKELERQDQQRVDDAVKRADPKEE